MNAAHAGRTGTRRLQYAAAASAAAGVIHVAAAVPHVGDDVLSGAGFLLVGWAQVVVAAQLLRGRDDGRLLGGAIVLHLVAVGAWAWSRTLGLPFGHGGVEALGVADAVTVAFEVAAVALLGWRLVRPRTSTRPTRPVVVAGFVGTWMLVLGGFAIAVGDLGSGGHGHGGGDHEAPSRAVAGGAPGADDLLHQHADRTFHVHVDADAHEHADGTVHLHDVAGSSDGGTDPDASPDGHTHAPGEEH